MIEIKTCRLKKPNLHSLTRLQSPCNFYARQLDLQLLQPLFPLFHLERSDILQNWISMSQKRYYGVRAYLCERMHHRKEDREQACRLKTTHVFRLNGLPSDSIFLLHTHQINIFL